MECIIQVSYLNSIALLVLNTGIIISVLLVRFRVFLLLPYELGNFFSGTLSHWLDAYQFSPGRQWSGIHFVLLLLQKLVSYLSNHACSKNYDRQPGLQVTNLSFIFCFTYLLRQDQFGKPQNSHRTVFNMWYLLFNNYLVLLLCDSGQSQLIT